MLSAVFLTYSGLQWIGKEAHVVWNRLPVLGQLTHLNVSLTQRHLATLGQPSIPAQRCP